MGTPRNLGLAKIGECSTLYSELNLFTPRVSHNSIRQRIFELAHSLFGQFLPEQLVTHYNNSPGNFRHHKISIFVGDNGRDGDSGVFQNPCPYEIARVTRQLVLAGKYTSKPVEDIDIWNFCLMGESSVE